MLKSILERIDLETVACNFVTYESDEEVALRIYEPNKELIYEENNIKTLGDYVSALFDDTNVINNSFIYALNYLKSLGEQDLVIFASMHSTDVLQDVVVSFLDEMRKQNMFISEIDGLMLSEFVSSDEIAEVDSFIKDCKTMGASFKKKQLATILSDYVPEHAVA